ncbi:hypothetical protein GGX14DRAFT_405638 [Mycena pura]|uniref:Uncharacterized protein n=1 Tax=Mycena pura TaxID=153505 RepID=A0AAD6URF4_9AGAR|nr:hypothetical protein GGX14DRAFT_405638 [Mycena pura]
MPIELISLLFTTVANTSASSSSTISTTIQSDIWSYEQAIAHLPDFLARCPGNITVPNRIRKNKNVVSKLIRLSCGIRGQWSVGPGFKPEPRPSPGVGSPSPTAGRAWALSGLGPGLEFQKARALGPEPG